MAHREMTWRTPGTGTEFILLCGLAVPAVSCCAMVMCAAAGVCIRVTTAASLAPAAVFLISRLLKARENYLRVQIIVTFSSLPLRLCLSIHVFMAHAAVNMASFSTAVPLPGGCLSRLHTDTLLAATIFVIVAALSTTGTQVSASVASALIRPVVVAV